MTPAEIEEMARRRYNAVNDTFWAQDEIFDMIYAACLEICDEGHAVERVYTTPTVASTQGYDFPTNAISVKRITYEGVKLTPMDMRDDDALTAMNQNTTSTGTPAYYWIWDRTIYLRPVPAAVGTLKIWTYNKQNEISAATTTIEIPGQHHARLINPVLSGMAAKDSNFKAADWYLKLWEQDKVRIKMSMRKMKRADGFATVKDESLVIESRIGGP